MFDLDGDVVGERRMLSVQCFDNSRGVPGPVEEIRISKGNVLGASRYLPPDVFQHDAALDDAKRSVIYRNDRTMPAQVLATAAGFGVANELFLTRPQQLG